MTRPAVFTQGDVSKLLKGAKAAGLTVTSVEIDLTGRMVAHFADGATMAPEVNEWDEALYGKAGRAAAQRQ